MKYTEEEIKRMYQLGYSHGANGRSPLEGAQVLQAAELGRADGESVERPA